MAGTACAAVHVYVQRAARCSFRTSVPALPGAWPARWQARGWQAKLSHLTKWPRQSSAAFKRAASRLVADGHMDAQGFGTLTRSASEAPRLRFGLVCSITHVDLVFTIEANHFSALAFDLNRSHRAVLTMKRDL